ncbi:hypothetical protein [Agromyces sp. Soil535]|uniref:hypothetical protein n=1 Tax=Agromyces sp. Soil535 TaxID=1736390 RepID=UPI0012E3466E|nr:hypothetical protein [Agromyces sp. Soil535]
MTITLNVLSPEDIRTRRAELLDSIHMSFQELKARGSVFALSPYEQGILDQILDLDYLGDGDS